VATTLLASSRAQTSVEVEKNRNMTELDQGDGNNVMNQQKIARLRRWRDEVVVVAKGRDSLETNLAEGTAVSLRPKG
jgi:hypothetical protein